MLGSTAAAQYESVSTASYRLASRTSSSTASSVGYVEAMIVTCCSWPRALPRVETLRMSLASMWAIVLLVRSPPQTCFPRHVRVERAYRKAVLMIARRQRSNRWSWLELPLDRVDWVGFALASTRSHTGAVPLPKAVAVRRGERRLARPRAQRDNRRRARSGCGVGQTARALPCCVGDGCTT